MANKEADVDVEAVPSPQVLGPVPALVMSEQFVKVEAPLGQSEEDKARGQTNIELAKASKDLVEMGQRRVNLIWETVQAVMAVAVILTTLYVCMRLALIGLNIEAATERQMSISTTALLLLSQIIGNIIGFYFGRTNHQKIGGVGSNVTGR